MKKRSVSEEKTLGYEIVELDNYKVITSNQINADKIDCLSAFEVKKSNKKWTSHSDLKKELGIE